MSYPLYIYLIQRTDPVGWDEYIEFVVVAPDEYTARYSHPQSIDDDDDWIDRDQAHTLNVTRLGIADPGIGPGVISASFNAG